MQNQRAERLSLKRQTLATLLQALADPALTRLEADHLSYAILQCLRERMQTDNLAILLLTEDHTALHIHTVLGLEEIVAPDVHIPLGRGFAGKIAMQGFPLIVHDTSTLEILTAVLREELCSLLGVPLIVHKQVIGVLHVGMKRKYLFTDSDVALLQYVADSLAQAFERTFLIPGEQHAVEELIEAQLCAVEELVEAQQRVATELVEAQQRVATELVEAQQRVAIELVGAQLHTAVELVGAQLHAAIELVGVQQPPAEELVEVQQRVATELVEAQLHAAGELVEIQQRVATELVEAQQPPAEELVEAQQRVATELVEAQLRVATELVEAQLPIVGELVEVQLHTATELIEAQLHAAEELVEAQLHTAGELVETQLPIAGELIEAQLRVAGELVGTQLHTATELVGTQLHTAAELVGAQLHTAAELVGAQLHTAAELVEGQLQVAIELIEAQQQAAIKLMEQQQHVRIQTFEQMNELETIFNAITDGVIVYDTQGYILRSNRAVHQLRDEHGDSCSAEYLPLERLFAGKRLGAKEAVTVYLHTLDDRDIQLSVTGAPLYNQQGHLYGAVCVLRDVTIQKQMEQRTEILDVFLQMVELLVKSSAPKNRTVPLDTSTQITQQIESAILALAQRLLGCSHAIIIGIHPSIQVLSPLALAGFSPEQELHLRTGLTGAHLSQLINDPNNVALLEKQESVPFTITNSPLLPYLSPLSSSPNCCLVPIYITHHLIGLFGIMFSESTSLRNLGGISLISTISKLCALVLQYEQQATEQDRLAAAKIFLNEQLEQANKMQGDFISVVSHEFRTSLTTIEGFSNLLRSDDYSSEEVKEFANDIYTDAIRLHRMVTDLLDVEQMKKGKMQLHVVGIDINALLTTIVKHIEPISTRHTLRLSLDEKLSQLEGDPEKLRQAIMNLLSNAIKYSPLGGDILITSSKQGNAVHVSIQDHGIGIAPAVIKNIFTPYHRVNSSSTRYIQGTGLGLSLVSEIIHQHDGTIWVESTPGHGSTFHLSLPLIRESLKTSNEAIEPDPFLVRVQMENEVRNFS